MNRLKELCTQQALSVWQQAAKAGVDSSVVNPIENGWRKAQLTTLVKLVSALGVPPRRIVLSRNGHL